MPSTQQLRNQPDEPDEPCPCGGTSYQDCCGILLSGSALATTPLQLMRSRYTAYVLGNMDYVYETWDPATRPRRDELGADPRVRWLGLNIKSVHPIDADHGEVEFVARHKLGGRATRLHERSVFERQAGRWQYVRASTLGDGIR